MTHFYGEASRLRLLSGAFIACCGLGVPGLAAAQTFNPLWAVPKSQVANDSDSASSMMPGRPDHGASFFAGVGDGARENILLPGRQQN